MGQRTGGRGLGARTLAAPGGAARAADARASAARAVASAAVVLVLAAGAGRALPLSPAWTGEGNQASAHYGWSVAAAGDVNGDGYSDVLVGARDYDAGQSNEGRAYLYLGGPDGPSSAADWTTEPDQSLAFLGQTVAPAGDVNGDGYDDVLVGAPNWMGAFSGEGRADLFFGSDSGLAALPAWTREGGAASATAGSGIATAGDVNGDGYADFLVGSRGWTGSFASEGRVELFLGGPSGPASTAAWTVEGGQANAALGWAVGTAGDVDADGYADVVLGAFFFDGDLVDEGAAYVYRGGPSGPAATPVWTVQGDAAGASFGWSVAGAGDVNGDGYADVLVGARFHPGAGVGEGRAALYLGGAAGPDTAAVWSVIGGQTNGNLGWSVATAGDVNGDGYADIVLGAYRYDSTWLDSGQARLHLGSPDGPSALPDWTADSGQQGAQFGYSVSGAGDVDGDGYSDVLVGANFHDAGQTDEGAAYLYRGGRDLPSAAPAWRGAGGPSALAYGSAVEFAGDVNGDGRADLLVADPLFNGVGRVDLYLGAEGGPDASPDWSELGAQSGESFGRSVASAGDVDGDGYEDLLVGSPFHDGAFLAGGRAAVWPGSSFGPGASPVWEVFGASPVAFLGHSVASAGDVNGDGYADVIVGAHQADGTAPDAGAAYVHHGSAAGLPVAPSRVLAGTQSGAQFGWRVASAGDVNGDGYSDVVVGEPAAADTYAEEGRAHLFLGSSSGVSATAAWTVTGGQAGARFGDDVASAGDVNGDGYSDVLVVARLWDGAQSDEGRASLYLGGPSGLATVPAWEAASGEAMAELSVARGAGDLDGDGFGDLLLGIPLHTGGRALQGEVRLYRGRAGGADTVAARTWTGSVALAQLGASVAARGDLHGDGEVDLILGAPGHADSVSSGGAAFLHPGNGGGARRLPHQLRSDGTAPVAPRGASDATGGFRIDAWARSAAGRTHVTPEWEIARLGVAFAGAPVAEPEIETGAPVPGAGSGAAFTAAPSGLTASGFYRWRLRLRTRSPWFPSTPWLSLAAVAAGETHLRTAPGGAAAPAGPAASGGGDLLAAPSPFRGAVGIRSSAAPAGPYSVHVVDVTGRRVRTLEPRRDPRGPVHLRWDGTDDAGRPVAAGVYFVRLESEGAPPAVRRVVRLR